MTVEVIGSALKLASAPSGQIPGNTWSASRLNEKGGSDATWSDWQERTRESLVARQNAIDDDDTEVGRIKPLFDLSSAS